MLSRSDLARRRHAQSGAAIGFNPNVPDFWAPLNDLGAGAVNTTLLRGAVAATFTRATAAWTRLSSGLWVQVASGVARSYYLPDLNYGGFVGEGARTNLALHSADFTNAAWVKTDMTAAKTATGPDGVANSASTLTATGANATALQAITSASASRIASTFIKRRTGSGVINITQDNGSTWTVVTVTNDWTQVASTNQTLTNPTVGIRIVTSGDEVDVWTFMNELGTYPSTPIPTVASTVPRNADVLTYPFILNAARGTVYAELSTLWGTSQPANNVAVAASLNARLIYNGSSVAATQVSMFDSTTVVSKTGLTNMSTGVRKRASSWGALGQIITGDGAAVASGLFDGAMGVGTTIDIGHADNGAAPFFGTIKNAKGWRLAQASAAELQQATT